MRAHRDSRLALAWLPALLALAGAAMPASAVAATADPTAVLLTYDLGGASCSLRADGEIVLSDGAGSALLTISLAAPAAPRVRTGFATVCQEGQAHGRCGFDADADDDLDGRRDEDPANGRDDDGDGLVDEDFAAIGEVMGVVDVPRRGGRLHLETYHWSYPQLRRGMVVSLRLPGAAVPGRVQAVAAGGAWRLADFVPVGETASRAEGAATMPAFVLRLPGTGQRTPSWLGVSPLAATTPGAPRPQASGSRLELPVAGSLQLVVAVAPSRLQLRRQLAAAHAVKAGAPDGRGGRVPWTIPPLCPVCLDGEHPTAGWTASGDGWSLVFRVRSGQDALIDPDRLLVAGQPLPAPERVAWQPDGGPTAGRPATGSAWVVPWSAPGADLAPPDLLPDLYDTCPGLLRHTAAGTLRFSYAGRPPWPWGGEVPALSGESLVGRPFELPLVADREAALVPTPGGSVAGSPAGEPNPAGGQAELGPGSGATAGSPAADTGDQRRLPQLSDELLRNFPNPFVDRTRIVFRVPATVGEAFPSEIAAALGGPEQPLSSTGSPAVSLKIYGLGGAELVELRGGSLSPGSYEAAWDGTDRFGHPVAAGAYFCKLQIGVWSVTKRIVFIR